MLDVFCIATGAMISSGIFVLPGLAHAMAGPAVIVSYFLAGLLAMIGMLHAAELATAMPRAGGDYFFITRTLGPAVGSVAGLIFWLTLTLKSAFAIVGMTAFVRMLIDLNVAVAGIPLCALFVGLNLAGSRHVGRFQVVLVLLLLASMVYYIIRGFPAIAVENLKPFAPHGFDRVLATAGFVFVAYGGLIKTSGVAGEVRNPARVIPISMTLSLIIVMLLYLLMILVTTGVLSSEQLDNSLTPITDGARQFMGKAGVAIVSLAAALSFITTANAGFMAASRYLYALSHDELLPAGLSRLTSRTRTPWIAVVVTGVAASVALFLKLDILVETASLVLILGFTLSCVCVIVLRESHVQNYRPSFQAPFYPWLPLAGILGYVLLIFEIGIEAYYICAILLLLGITNYWLYGRRRVRRDYALLHLIERLTSRELVTGTLERELKHIVRERDEIVVDRLDQMIANCPVLDIEEQIDVEACFDQLADVLADRLNMDHDRVARLFTDREQEASTVLNDFIAIPHIVIPGSGSFHIALVRARGGIRFAGNDKPVHALFALLGTRDERNLHLRVLAAVAQLVQEPDFEQRWLNARDEQGIRDVILLGRRLRGHLGGPDVVMV